MTTTRRPVSFTKFGGLRLDAPVDEVPSDQAIDMLDVDWEGQTDGGIRPRDGASKVTAVAAVYPYFALWRHSDTRLLASTAAANVAIEPGGAVQKSRPAEGVPIYASLGTPSASYTYMANKGHGISRYDGTNFTPSVKATVDGVGEKAMPDSRYIAAWTLGDRANRLVFANTGSTGGPGGAASSVSHVWFSENGSPESFESTAYDQLSVGDGEEITGMVEWSGQLFVFKRTRMFVFYGVDTDEEGKPIFRRKTFDLPSPHFGGSTNGGQRVVAAKDGVYFVCQDGVYVSNGGPPGKASNALLALDVPRAIPGPAAATFGDTRWLDFTQLFYFRSRLYVIGEDLTLVYDMDRGEWLVWKTAITSMASWNADSGGPDYLYFSSGKNIYRFDPAAESDPTVEMEPRWQSGFYDLGSQDEKEMVGVRAFGSGTIDAQSLSDLDDQPSPSGAHLEFPSSGSRSVYDENGLTDSGVMFSHKLSLEPDSRIQRLVRYLRETRTSGTKGDR
jgi:hypothetical protein